MAKIYVSPDTDVGKAVFGYSVSANSRPRGCYKVLTGRDGLIFGTLFNNMQRGDQPYQEWIDYSTIFSTDRTYIGSDYTRFTGYDTIYSYISNGKLLVEGLGDQLNDEATLMLRLKKYLSQNSGIFRLDTYTGSSTANHWPYSGTAYLNPFLSTARISFSQSETGLDDWHWLIVRTKPGASNYEVFLDGTSKYTGTGPSTISVPTTIGIGASRRDSDGDGYSAFADFDVGYIFNRYLSTAELEDIRNNRYKYMEPLRNPGIVFDGLALPSYYVAVDTTTPPSYEVAMDVEYT